MTHPLWILNSTLAGLLLAGSLFVYMSRVTLPPREEIEPLLYSKPQKQQYVSINLKHIYENDLFGTYKKEIPRSEMPIQIKPLPQPPRPQMVSVPAPPQPTFLEPLNISLHGIIAISSDEDKSRAIIADNKTDQETLYKVGDKLQDAQLIRIFNNKIVLLRSNGQQEVIYMRDQDAQTDPRFAQIENWHLAIEMINATTYRIFPEAFLKRVENVAHFIELLNLTTAYQKGIPVGTRVGAIEVQSLGSHLGLRTADMILSIQGIPATTTDDRLVIYNSIIRARLPYEISVEIMRGNRTVELKYIIEPFKIETVKATPVVTPVEQPTTKEVLPHELSDYQESDMAEMSNDMGSPESSISGDGDEMAMLQMLRQKEAFLMVEQGALDKEIDQKAKSEIQDSI
jgi:type II secretory pathway component PulC